MKQIAFACIAIAALTLSSCGERIQGNGNVVEVSHELSSFDEIDISGMFEVELLKGGSEVEVITDENLHEHINVKVEDDRLIIDTDDKYLEADKLLLRIQYDDLESVEASGAIELSVDKTLKSDEFSLDVSGACDARMDVNVDLLDIEISGGGEIELTGKADEVNFDISGAGDIDAIDLKTKVASIDVTGAGEVKITVSDRLDVDITGAGDVRYKGDPEINQSITGAGSVEKL